MMPSTEHIHRQLELPTQKVRADMRVRSHVLALSAASAGVKCNISSNVESLDIVGDHVTLNSRVRLRGGEDVSTGPNPTSTGDHFPCTKERLDYRETRKDPRASIRAGTSLNLGRRIGPSAMVSSYSVVTSSVPPTPSSSETQPARSDVWMQTIHNHVTPTVRSLYTHNLLPLCLSVRATNMRGDVSAATSEPKRDCVWIYPME